MIDGNVDGPVSNVGNDNQGVIADSVSVGTLQSNKNIHHGDVRNHHGDIHFHVHPSSLGEILSANPVSSLESAFETLKDVFDRYKQVEANQTQLLVLNETLAQLLKTLNGRYENQGQVESQTEGSLDNLERLLDDVVTFTETCTSQNILKQVMTKENRQSQITGYHHRIQSLITSLQMPTPTHIKDAPARDNRARVEDQRILDQRLDSIQKHRRELRKVLDDTIGQSTASALMVSLQRHSQTTSSDAEKRFLTRAHQNLSATTREQTKVESWVITSYEVEFGRKIGSGGFGQVFLGKWGKMEVALKVLRVENGATPSARTVRREVEIWASLRHAHILAFYGANVLDESPFIVMAYLKNGNSLEYIDRNPGCNRLRMLHDVSLGLYYLHSKDIVHGDLKAANILIDDAGKAVLADFGLSRVKADATSRTTKQGGSIVAGSRNWMAPELLTGGSLRKPCDVYSFGMTIFEIYTTEIPLSNIPYGDFIEMVVKNHVRPQRQGLPDEIWKLADRCWVSLGKGERPDAGSIYDMVSHLMQTTPVPSPTPTNALPLVQSKHPLDTSAIVTSARPIQPLPPLVGPLLPPEKPLRLFEGNTSNVRSVDGTRIASGSDDKTVHLGDPSIGAVLSTMSTVAVAPDSRVSPPPTHTIDLKELADNTTQFLKALSPFYARSTLWSFRAIRLGHSNGNMKAEVATQSKNYVKAINYSIDASQFSYSLATEAIAAAEFILQVKKDEQNAPEEEKANLKAKGLISLDSYMKSASAFAKKGHELANNAIVAFLNVKSGLNTLVEKYQTKAEETDDVEVKAVLVALKKFESTLQVYVEWWNEMEMVHSTQQSRILLKFNSIRHRSILEMWTKLQRKYEDYAKKIIVTKLSYPEVFSAAV